MLAKKRLRKNAVPSIFTNLPHYCSNCYDAPSRSGLSLSSSRLEREAATLDAQCESFLNQDKVTNFEELVTKLSDEAQAKGFLIQETNDYCNFILLSQEHRLSIQGTIAVNRSLEVKIYCKQQTVPPSSYDHVMTSDKVTVLSEITNLLAFTKNLETSKGTMEETFKLKFLQLVNEQLKIAENDQQHRWLKFILEQVSLLFQGKRRRRYSIQFNC